MHEPIASHEPKVLFGGVVASQTGIEEIHSIRLVFCRRSVNIHILMSQTNKIVTNFSHYAWDFRDTYWFIGLYLAFSYNVNGMLVI